MNKLDILRITLANYEALAGHIAQALKRDEGMTTDEVRNLAVMSMAISGNLATLADAVEPRTHLSRPTSWSETHVACGKFSSQRTDDRAKVTCKNCRGTKVFNETDA